jgi:hypothetical protein
VFWKESSESIEAGRKEKNKEKDEDCALPVERDEDGPGDGAEHRDDRDEILEDGESPARTDVVGETTGA